MLFKISFIGGHRIIPDAINICRSTKQKFNKETQTLNDTIDQLDLIDIYRTFHPKTMNFTFFSSTHGTFSGIDHILGHKSSLGKYKKIEIIPSIFSDHNIVRLHPNASSFLPSSQADMLCFSSPRAARIHSALSLQTWEGGGWGRGCCANCLSRFVTGANYAFLAEGITGDRIHLG